MRRCQPPQTEFASSGEGPGCVLFISQDPSDAGGWKLHLYAELDERDSPAAVVGEFTITAAAGAVSLNRVVAVACIPGTSRYSVVVYPPSPIPAGLKSLKVGLVASKGVFAIGVAAVLP